MSQEMHTVGRVERVDFPVLGVSNVPAKVDTGADLSSIWSYSSRETPHGLECVFFAPDSPFYTGDTVTFAASDYSITRIANSFGTKELRYKVKLSIRIGGRKVKGTFTLSKRATKTYPVLIGRRLLHGKFVVDVSKGTPLRKLEKQRKEQLEKDLAALKMRGAS